ncbi:hypothetical protein AB4Y72_14915 [Arthrobacter sp. YAF34]|uniref:hypothetical protein n=1 Tax=Arthrobacter sp. YAF34 TaxID=3233083 RepID=UPI003F911AFC
MSTTFVSFTLTATAREGGEERFRSDIWQVTSAPLGGATLTLAGAEGTTAVFNGVIPETRRTADAVTLVSFLEDHLATTKSIHLDLAVNIHRGR